jgi:hypothetical protein
MTESSKPCSNPRLRVVVGSMAALLLVAACASTPPPTVALQAAQVAITNAERADAGHYSPAELGEARKRLASADTSVKEQRMVMAERFADQARAQAELASAKTEAAKAQAVNTEMKTSTGTLIEEMKRSSGDKP